MRTFPILSMLAACAIIGCGGSGETKVGSTPAEQRPSIYFVAEYDPARRAQDDLTAAVAVARPKGKRILLQVGGEWCGWCHTMTDFFEQHPDIADALRRDFVLLKINYSQDHPNAEFLSRFPAMGGYPHLFVLDPDGQFLHSQDTVELEEGDSYSHDKVLAFLENWR